MPQIQTPLRPHRIIMHRLPATQHLPCSSFQSKITYKLRRLPTRKGQVKMEKEQGLKTLGDYRRADRKTQKRWIEQYLFFKPRSICASSFVMRDAKKSYEKIDSI
jgi:hypothetical protein